MGEPITDEPRKASLYTVVQYYPSVVSDECINVALLAFGNGEFAYRTLYNWSRVRFMSRHEVVGIRDYIERLINHVKTTDYKTGFETIEQSISHNNNSIQFTAWRATTLSPEDFITRHHHHFLTQDEEESSYGMTRSQACRLMQSQGIHIDEREEDLIKLVMITHQFTVYQFDELLRVCHKIINSGTYKEIGGRSREGLETVDLRRATDALYKGCEDLKLVLKKIPQP